MEFPAGAATNLRMTDIYSTIYWKIYSIDSLPAPGREKSGEPSTDPATEFESAILALRNQGCITDASPKGDGLWVFSHNDDFEKLREFSVLETDQPFGVLQIGLVRFRHYHSESTQLGYLVKRLMSEPQSTILSPVTQQKFESKKESSPINRESITASAFYKAFTAAVAGLLSLRAIQMYGAVPLGKRTLFFLCDSDDPLRDACTGRIPQKTPFLSVLYLELSFKSLIVSWRTIPQPGLQQLSRTIASDTENSISLHESMWLAPTGWLCRYIGPDPSPNVGSQWEPALNDNGELELSPSNSPSFVREWKKTVYQRLQKLGLFSGEMIAEPWVEVEAIDRLQRAESNTGAESQSNRASKRFLWPARLCFKRSVQSTPSILEEAKYFDPSTLDPLQFTEQWLKEIAASKLFEDQVMTPKNRGEEKLEHNLAPSPAATRTLANITSLARKSNFFEFPAGAVYPTPPGGISGVGALSIATSDGSFIPAGPGSGSVITTSLSVPGMETTNSGLEIGSGMYDTTVDDDLFGELDQNFGDKELTEADFNFFDEPDPPPFLDEEDTPMPDANSIRNLSDTPPKSNVSPFYEIDKETGPSPSPLRANQRNRPAKDDPIPSTLASPSGRDVIRSPKPKMNITTGNDTHTPLSPHKPLSPVQVREILASGSRGALPSVSPIYSRKRKVKNRYQPISFTKSLGLSDEKYELDGRFWFLPGDKKAPSLENENTYAPDIPTVGIPKWPLKSRRRLSSITASTDDFRSESTMSESSESGSEVDASSPSQPAPHLRILLAGKSNLHLPKENDITPSPLEKSTAATELSNIGIDVSMLAFLPKLLFGGTDWSLDGYFPVIRSQRPTLLRKEDFIQVVQLIVDQVTQCSLKLKEQSYAVKDTRRQTSFPLCSTEKDSWHGKFGTFDLRRYTSIDDENSAQSLRKDVRYTTVGSINKLDPPHIRIHRGKGFLEILPPAILFWEPFSFEPILGTKDIITYCIYPECSREGVNAFLDRFGLIYTSANLGRHSRAPDPNGLISWTLDPTGGRDYPTIMNKLQSICEHLGEAISKVPPKNENNVVFIVNPFSCEAAIVDICSAFLCLFRKYVSKSAKEVTRLNEVALQIIPMDFVASLDTLVVPPQLDYLHLAFEVYSRCPPKTRPSDLLGCAPPFILAKSIPKAVPFKLVADPSSPLLDRHSMHVAYSESLDRRWVTAAWTDNIGKDQLTMTYCLRAKGSTKSKPVSEIRADVWDVTLHLIGKSQSYWRVMIVKDEPVEMEEAEAWISLAQRHNQSTKPTKVELTLLSANINPCLHFTLPPPPLQLNGLNHSTPVPSPNPAVPSPDPSAAAATPPASTADQANTPLTPSLDAPDSDTIIIDKSDETWSITLSHRLNISPSLTNYHSALASGFLVRRRHGTSDTEGIASLGVNIIFTLARTPTEMLLKDILRMYRELATLAKAKGIYHAKGDQVLPWHISTAVKGREFLSVVL